MMMLASQRHLTERTRITVTMSEPLRVSTLLSEIDNIARGAGVYVAKLIQE